MFVKDNSISSVESYFEEKLSNQFSKREIKLIAKALIAKRLDFDENEYLLHKHNNVSESDLLFFRASIKRLQENEPLEHIVGYTFFYDLKINCSPSALIPRPETEELVDWIVGDYRNQQNLQVLDVCTGTGCIALALKNTNDTWKVEGIDISTESIDLSKQNARELGLGVAFNIKDALQLNLSADWYDCIVSNPPYIPKKDKSEMHENVLKFEPGIALFVEDHDPLLFYREIGVRAFKGLKNNGNLYFEIHEDFALATRELLIALGYFSVEIKKDLQGKDRMIKATKFI